jgi:5-hydroxyisourate hydrolase
MNTLSTHVLDTSIGRPATGIRVTVERLTKSTAGSSGAESAIVGTGTTEANGRIADLINPEETFAAGAYRLRFDVAEYFVRTGRAVFYPEIVVMFVVQSDNEHYHIPLLLNPFGYSTYRGS